MTKSLFIIDKIKALVLTVIFGGGAIYAIIGLFISVGDWFLLVAWIAVTVIFVFVNMIYTKWIVPIFNKLKPLEDSSLKTKIFAFAKSVGYEVGKISVMNASKRSTKLNAFFSGFSKTARVVLYDTLIEKMDEEEVVAVLAHEIGHNKRKHIVFNIFQTVLLLSVYIFGLMIFLRQDIFSLAFGLSEINYGFNIIVYVVVLSIVMLFLNLPLSFLSRKFEYQADEFASKNYSDLHMINALIKLSRENFSNLNPHPLYVKFYYTHPPLYQRIAAIKS
jgi:STE24 endopeptidase